MTGRREEEGVYYAREVVERLRKSRTLVIFGAGLVAMEVANCLMGKPYGLSICGFLVSEGGKNPKQILGLPVLSLEEAKGKFQKETLIVIAVMGKHIDEICGNLCRYGYRNLLSMTFEGDLWSLIQGNYVREFRLSQSKDYLTLEEELERVCVPAKTEASGSQGHTVHVYTAKCHVDRSLNEDLSRYHWEIPIQVGTALTKERICEQCDNQGENISHKNGQYCELTALYWIWKQESSSYVGLCHYRRHFELDEELLKRLAYSDIDVVLTIPILNFPNVKAVYKHDHVEADWKVMMEGIHTLQPDYSETAEKLQNGNFYYGYNMLIARKEIFDDYCAWLFPILEYCEEQCGEKESTYQKRYIGFLAERLMGIYFLRHEKEYKIVHARKHFVER